MNLFLSNHYKCNSLVTLCSHIIRKTPKFNRVGAKPERKKGMLSKMLSGMTVHVFLYTSSQSIIKQVSSKQ